MPVTVKLCVRLALVSDIVLAFASMVSLYGR